MTNSGCALLMVTQTTFPMCGTTVEHPEETLSVVIACTTHMHSQEIPSWLETVHKYCAMHCVL